MSENAAAAPTAAPEVATTTTADSGAAPEAPTQTGAQKPATAADFLKGVNDRARGKTPAVVDDAPAVTVDATGRHHGTDGKFVEKVDPYSGATNVGDEGAGDEPAPSPEQQEVPAAEASADGATAPVAGDEPAVETVKIELPEDHPLRARGLTELPVPKQFEQEMRNLLNEPTRKRDLAEAHEARRRLEQTVAELRAEAEFWRDQQSQFLTPEFYAQYEDIRQTYGDDAAERYKRGVLQDAQGKLNERRQQAQAQMQVKETVNTALQFRQAAVADAQAQFPGWTPAEVNQALQAYGAWLNATGTTEPTAQDWYRIARPLYESSPAGQARRAELAKQTEAQAAARAAEEAKERERAQLEAAAQKRQRNPLQGAPNVQTGLAVPGTGTQHKTAKDFLTHVDRRARGYA